MKLTLNLPMLAGKSVTYYHETVSKDKKALWPVSQMKTVKVDKKGNLKVEMQPKGGLIINDWTCETWINKERIKAVFTPKTAFWTISTYLLLFISHFIR